MTQTYPHTFHIPVMGLAYSIDTPIKVARFGISSVVSIIQDILLEQMRELFCNEMGETFVAVPDEDIDHRAKRVIVYLNMMQEIIDKQLTKMKKESFEEGSDIVKYFKLLPDNSPVKNLYVEMTKMEGGEKELMQNQLREKIVAGAIDVNIMTKVDNLNYAKDGQALPIEYSDALSIFRGYAQSSLSSSVVFSAGLNPRLYAYVENFPDFFPDEKGEIKKKIILKVSDYRSAMIQGKFLAKKGIWVSEFRIESGLNCGGHAFPTQGYLLGPILEEFKHKKTALVNELFDLFNQSIKGTTRNGFQEKPGIRITVQGGIGTRNEDKLLREYYNLDGTGWGSPFLLVPETTTVDDNTLQQLVSAKQEDYFLSHASPLGIPFNNFRKSTSEDQRKNRIEKNRPGSPCYKKFLSFNTEFTERPICVSSREYQDKKLKSIQADSNLSEIKKIMMSQEVMEKDCLCEGLTSPALLKNKIPDRHRLEAVTICPGPNLAYFSKISTLEEMVGHIYGRVNILNSNYRPHMFINELKMYVDYLKKELDKNIDPLNEKLSKHFLSFKTNILQGIDYYKNLLPKMTEEAEEIKMKMNEEIEALKMVMNLTQIANV